jgi:polyhydroxybutyrate depolymerase
MADAVITNRHRRACALVAGVLIVCVIWGGCITPRESLLYDGQTRTYLLHVPSTYDGHSPVPLVIVLHGGGGNAENIEKVTGFSDLADREGFIVVYPDGTGRLDYRLLTWNGGFCCGYALENNVDDVGFIRALIPHLQQNYSINASRIYATGISNGGIMSYRLGAELSDILAAIAPVAGSIGGQASEQESLWRIPEPLCPLSVIAFHGTHDTRIPYDGGRPTENNTRGAYSYLSVNESIAFWVTYDDCETPPERNISSSGNIITDTYNGGKDNTSVVLYTIINGTHSWPGGTKGRERGDEPTMEISATEIMWEFFQNHPKH